MATRLDGKALAQRIREQLVGEVVELTRALGRPPGLGVILVGEDEGSQIYVRNKERAAQQAGIRSVTERLPASIDLTALLAAVEAMNAHDAIDAFIVQLPLPPGLDAGLVVDRILPAKDADGLHPVNLGRLVAGLDAPRPCTPAGIMALLDEAHVELAGQRAVVIGRSTIVGKPVAFMLLERHATVTLCHSRTVDLADEVRRADVVVAAVGRPRTILGEWVKPGAVVIDVGTNRVGDRVVGDVEFEAASMRASAITPVPGGVGPMTIAMLLRNTVVAARRTSMRDPRPAV